MDYDIIIYCGEKCGSSTLYETFNNLNKKVLHVHSNNNYKDINMKNKSKFETVEELIKSHTCDLYVIDVYRNPIERFISHFFQFTNNLTDVDNNGNTIDFNIINYILYKYQFIMTNNPLDLEFPILKDISFDENYLHHKVNNINYIKLTFDNISKWSEQLSTIFGKEIVIIDSNKSEDKYYYDMYDKFKKEYKLSRSFLEFIKTDKLFQKYNSIKKQDDYFKKWKNKVVDDLYFIGSLSNIKFIRTLDNFDVNSYKNCEFDIDFDIFKSDMDLKIHHEIYGYQFYKNKNLLPSDFDWKNYCELYDDLQFTNKNDAIIHYVNYGYYEGRFYKINKSLLPDIF